MLPISRRLVPIAQMRPSPLDTALKITTYGTLLLQGAMVLAIVTMIICGCIAHEFDISLEDLTSIPSRIRQTIFK